MVYLHLQTNNDELREHYQTASAAYQGDAGIDLICPETLVIPPGETKGIDFEIRCEMRADDHFPMSFWLLPRSSIVKTPLLMANSMGLIDSAYRGPLKAFVYNRSPITEYTIQKGTRLFQIASACLEPIQVRVVDELSDTSRGEKGFGSSG